MKHITILPSGYGHYKISVLYYNKEIWCITSNTRAIDDYNSDDSERDGRELRKKRGYETLYNEIIYKNKQKTI